MTTESSLQSQDRTATKESMLSAALGYANRGWPVLPLHTVQNGRCTCGKADCSSPGKHPRTRNGLSDATTDEGQITAWFTRWTDANVGVVTGPASGLLAVDVDGEDGAKNLAALKSKYGEVSTVTVRTGNGRHLLFRHPGLNVKNSVGRVTPHVDVRAERAYIVAPPSIHYTGKQYRFENPNAELAEIPDWLLARMTDRKQRIDNLMEHNERNAFTEAEIVSEGKRNDTLYKLGCALRGQHGSDEQEIAAILIEFNTAKCDPPLTEPEVMQIVKSVCLFPAEIASKKSAKRTDENPLYWFKFNVREYFADENTNLMTDFQTGWHIRLTAFAWRRGGFLPADTNKLFKLAKAKSKKAFENDCGLVLEEYEPVTVNGVSMLKNTRMAAQYAEVLSKWVQKQEAGTASRNAWLKRNKEAHGGEATIQ